MYGTVDQIAQVFAPAQWNPATHDPDTAAVTEWLDDWSAVLDGQLANVVDVPVDPDTSPRLHAICSQITVLRVRAEVYDMKYPAGKSEPVDTRTSTVWRRQADRLIEQIQGGMTADGVPVSGAQDLSTGPVGNFPSTSSGPFGKREGQW